MMPLFLPLLLLLLSQRRPGYLPLRARVVIDLADAQDPCSVDSHTVRAAFARRILDIIAKDVMADKVWRAVGPGVEFGAHQPGCDVVFEVVVAGSASRININTYIIFFIFVFLYLPRRRMLQEQSRI